MSDSSPLLDVTKTADGFRLSGEIDASSATVLSERLDPLPPAGMRVVLDLAGVGFIDSSGLRVIIDAHRRAEEAGRQVVIADPSTAVRRLFEISGLTGYLHVEEAAD